MTASSETQEGGLMQAIRRRPGMYFGNDVSLASLYHFISGYEIARMQWQPTAENPFGIPSDFADWVAYRLHFYEISRGWKGMIEERCGGDGRAAFDRFYELLDEHGSRRPTLVAKVTGLSRSFTRISAEGERRLAYHPSELELISYTEDPGLFVTGKGSFPGQGYCPSLQSFEACFGVGADHLTVLDPAAFQRWANSPI